MIEAKTNQGRESKLNRRIFLLAGVGAAAAAVFHLQRGSGLVEAKDRVPKEVKIVEFSDSGQREDTVTVPMIIKSDAEWRHQLSPQVFDITRRAGTERAYSGMYWNLHDKGIYRCICCQTALFSSDTKFDSGTGWPSFWQPIAKENVSESADLSMGMMRVAVSCKRCDAHLGHLFEDGPRPTGLRYCMNSLSLNFVKIA